MARVKTRGINSSLTPMFCRSLRYPLVDPHTVSNGQKDRIQTAQTGRSLEVYSSRIRHLNMTYFMAEIGLCLVLQAEIVSKIRALIDVLI